MSSEEAGRFPSCPQPARPHLSHPVSRFNSALRERRIQTDSRHRLLNFDLLGSPVGSLRRARQGHGYELQEPNGLFPAQPGPARVAPSTLTSRAAAPSLGPEPKQSLEVREATATPGPQGPYGHRPRAAAERHGAYGLRPGLGAALSCCASRRRSPRGAAEGQGSQEQKWWWQLILPQGDVAGRSGHQAALSPGLRSPAGGVLREPYRPAFSPRTRWPQRQSLHQRQP